MKAALSRYVIDTPTGAQDSALRHNTYVAKKKLITLSNSSSKQRSVDKSQIQKSVPKIRNKPFSLDLR